MKALLLSFLLAAGVGVANGAAYCSGSINSNLQVNSTVAGSAHIGNGCSVSPKCVLTLCGLELPHSGLPATSTFEGGVVGAGGAIIVQGPSFEVAANCVPFIVTVKKNRFEQDAALQFCGSLPPSSVVTISDNTLNCTKPNPAFGYDDRIVTILLGDADPMHLCAKSQLSVIRNIVCAINPCALLALAAFAIACFVQILLQMAACCRCCENDCTAVVPPVIKTTTTATTNAAGSDAPGTQGTFGPGSSESTSNEGTSTEGTSTEGTSMTPTTTTTTPTTTTTTTTTPTTTTTTASTTTDSSTTTTTTTPTTTTTTTPTTTTTTPTTTTTTATTTTTTPTTTTTTTTTPTTTTTTPTTTTTTTTTVPATPKPTGACSSCACGVELSIVITVSFSAVFSVDSNAFNICEGLAFTAPVIVALASAAISFSFNKCVIDGGDGVVCRFHDINADNGTVVSCQENSFESHNCPCIMECARPIVLHGSAKFELCLNTFVSFGGSPQMLFSGDATLVGDAKLLIMSNTMSRGDAQACDLPFFAFEAFISLSISAELCISLNDCFDNAGADKVLLCALAIGKAISPCATCPVNVCLNKYYDELLQTQEALGAAVSANLASLLAPVSTCAESGYSTLAPRDSGVSAHGASVALAAVAAAAALLL